MNTELTKENLKNIYGTVSPFEFKDKLLKLASLNNNTIYVRLKNNLFKYT